MTQGLLRIYVEDKNGNIVSFPNDKEQAVVKDWTRTAERMAGAPSVSGTVLHRLCLDNLWTKKEFVVINNERYYVRQVPTSSKDNEDVRYKHNITLVSEREILENIFFFDCVAKDTQSQTDDKPRSNNTEFSFYGDLNELVSRLNDSLSYSSIYDANGVNGFCVVIDDGIDVSETKEVSITDAYFATAIQEIYNTFDIPYYWIGKICHVGYCETDIQQSFEYGQGNGLVSVQKNNAEFRIINRITGVGSSDNIPYYYPNTDPNGVADFDTFNIKSKEEVEVLSSLLTSNIGTDYLHKNIVLSKNALSKEFSIPASDVPAKFVGGVFIGVHYYSGESVVDILCYLPAGTIVDVSSLKGSAYSTNTDAAIVIDTSREVRKLCQYFESRDSLLNSQVMSEAEEVPINKEIDREGYWRFRLSIPWKVKCDEGYGPNYVGINKEGSFVIKYSNKEQYSWNIGDVFIPYSNSGITVPSIDIQPCSESDVILSNNDKAFGETIYKIENITVKENPSPATIVINSISRIPVMSNLMPSIYRNSEGNERFYNAINGAYILEGEDDFHHFNNPFVKGEPLEGKQDFNDIKPSIEGVKNSEGFLFGEVADVAFDATDSDDLAVEKGNDTTANLVHGYFYIKLHKFNGDYGFNLFKQGLSKGAMTLNFTSGSCAGCAFEVGVPEGEQKDNHYEFKNPVQVDNSGNIVAGDYDDKVKEGNPIDSQQDTTANEVWIALKKDQSTFGVVMPNATNNYRPKTGDKFVITNILLPQVYITAAEKRLDAALIKYMSENNDEKFTFSITFSRIYLQEHPDISKKINENSKIHIRYNGKDYPLYVSSYTRKADDNILEEITVELSEKLTVAQSRSKEQMDSILGNVKEMFDSINIGYSQGSNVDFSSLYRLINNKLSKTTDDTASGIITFLRGIISNGLIEANSGAEFGRFVKGLLDGRGAVIDKDGNAEVESLRVRSSMEILELIINRLRAVDGDLLLTEGDTVESVEMLGEGMYRLKLKEQWEGYYTAQYENNVLKGVVNTLAKGSGTYQTSWMRVLTVDTERNTIDVLMYPDNDTPAGKNYPPCELMNVARWGNATFPGRQSCLYLSSSEGVIKKLRGVTKPIIDSGNTGFVVGELPDWIKNNEDLPIVDGSDYVYARGLIYQTLIQMDYQGKPVPTYVDRGDWMQNPTEPYHCEAQNSITGVWETSDVWYVGCKWRCIKDRPTGAPRWNSTEWAQIEGNPDFTIEIEVENGGLLDWDYFALHGTELQVKGRIFNMDVTEDIKDEDVTWTRYSEFEDGTPRTGSDEIWNNADHKGKNLMLTKDDANMDSAGLPRVLVFTARAVLRDGMEAEYSVGMI